MEGVNLVDFQAVGFRCAQAHFHLVAGERVLLLRRLKRHIFQKQLAVGIEQVGLGNIGVGFAVVKQHKIFAFIAAGVVFQQIQRAQIAAFLINHGFYRVGGHRDRGDGAERRFLNRVIGRGGLLLALCGLLCGSRLRAGEHLLPAEQNQQRKAEKNH